MELRFKHPFCMLVSGPTGSGKTWLIYDFIGDFSNTTTISKSGINILYCYGIWQATYEKPLPANVKVTFHRGFCYDYEDYRPDLVIIDDLMLELANDKGLVGMFTKNSHHKGISVIFLTQNLFFQSKEIRTISLNSHYICLLKNPRDKLQVMTLGRQIFPGNSTFFVEAYEEAVKDPFSHLIIDMTSACPDELRLRQRKVINGKKGYIIFEMRK